MSLFKPFFQTTFMHHLDCYVGNKIPGHIIIKSFGLVYQVTKGIRGNINDKLEKVVNDFAKKAANNSRANAIINFKFEIGAYEQDGSTAITSFIIVYGEPVITEPIKPAS